MSNQLVCSACDTPTDNLSAYSCARCWGPLSYSLRQARKNPGEGIWRYAQRLPAEVDPLPGSLVGNTPLLAAPRLAEAWGVAEVWVKNETANPTHSFKDRVVAVAVARARYLGLETLACTSTGNLGHALAAACAQAGLRCVVLVPEGVEAAKTAAARALGARVVPIQGSYDDVNRVAHLLADEVDWGWVNMTLRPYYAEGSKTLIWEILDQLTPTDMIAPLASGSLYSKLAAGAAQVGASSIRFHGAQAAGCAPISQAFAAGVEVVQPVRPASRAHSLAIGTPADGDRALAVARASGGQIVAAPEEELPQGVALLGQTSGVLTESAGAVTTLGAQLLADQGTFAADARVVLVITGDGLKGLDLVEEAASAEASVEAKPDAVLDAVLAPA